MPFPVQLVLFNRKLKKKIIRACQFALIASSSVLLSCVVWYCVMSGITWRCKWHLGLQLWQVSTHSFAVRWCQALCSCRQTLNTASPGQRQSPQWVSLKEQKKTFITEACFDTISFTSNFMWSQTKNQWFNHNEGEELIYLWLEVRRKLRRYLDSVIASLRITVLHVCVAFVARAGASVVHIGTCYSQRHRTGFMLSQLLCLSSKILHYFGAVKSFNGL